MRDQRHVIKRQVLELHVGNAADAQQLQAEISRIYRQRILPLIDRYCTELSAPDVIYRIDSLELDLGPVDPRHLEDDIVTKVREQLRARLAEQIRAQARQGDRPTASLKTSSQLELFSLFAQTGSLPWWADVSQPRIVDAALDDLVRQAPAAVRHLIRELARQPRYLHRIVQHVDEARLVALVGILIPPLRATLPQLVQALVGLLPTTSVLAQRQPAPLRSLAWTQVLQLAGREGSRYRDASVFCQDLLAQMASVTGVTYASLLSDMRQSLLAGPTPLRLQSADRVEALDQTLQPDTRAQQASLAALLDRWRRTGGALATLAAVWQPVAPQLPPTFQTRLLNILHQIESSVKAEPPRQSEAVIRPLRRLLQSLLTQRLLPVSVVQQWRQDVEQLTLRGPMEDVVQALLTELDEPVPVEIRPEPQDDTLPPVDLRFSDADELYVSNAGLVILWPFLRHFFAHLGLLNDQQFKDTAARQRAVGLLQYLATEDPSPPEYLVPLNKVLCGMDLRDVFDFGPPVSETEVEECTNLLTAVIAQAPILNNMSIAGFRGTFLLRQGMLSARDGAWLLRVERETYDVVLDRFPWSIAWVNAPWMDTLLRVEW